MKFLSTLSLVLPLLFVGQSAPAQDFFSEDLINLETDTSGVYEVSYQHLLATTGLDLAGEPIHRIALVNQGNSVPLQVRGSDADSSVLVLALAFVLSLRS